MFNKIMNYLYYYCCPYLLIDTNQVVCDWYRKLVYLKNKYIIKINGIDKYCTNAYHF